MSASVVIRLNSIDLTVEDRTVVVSQASSQVVAVGTSGPQGPAGATGPTGPTGVIAATDPIVYTAGTQTISANSTSLRTLSRQAATNPLRRWQKDYAAARRGLLYGETTEQNTADIVVIGDSITEGSSATPNAVTGEFTTYVRRFAALLAETANPDGRVPEYLPCSVLNFRTPNWASSGSITSASNGLALKRTLINVGGEMSVTLTGTSAVVYYQRTYTFPYTRGDIRIRVYEGTGFAGTLLFDRTENTNDGTLPLNYQAVVAQHIPAWGGRKTVTFRVNQEAGTRGVLCDGVLINDGTEKQGVRVWQSGKASSNFATWNSPVNVTNNSDWLAIMRPGFTAADQSDPITGTSPIGNLNPSLVVVNLGVNNFQNDIPAITSGMETLITNINATARDNTGNAPSYAFIIPPATGNKNAVDWEACRLAMYAKAEELNAAIWDWSSLTGDYSLTTGDPLDWSPDGIHPNNAGHVAIGDYITSEALAGIADVAGLEGFAASIAASGIATWDTGTRTITVTTGTTATTAAAGNDSRLSDSRTPTTHATTHKTGGTDPLTATSIGAIPLRWKTGTYIRTPMGTTAVGTTGLTLNRSFCTGLYVPQGGAIDRVGIEVTTVGGAGSVTRIGLYADNNGLPGELLFDAGTVDTATATGYLQATVNWTGLNDGLYWVATVPQVGTAPIVRSVSAPLSGFAPYRNTSISNNPDNWGVYGQNMTGALAQTFTFAATTGAPLILIRCA